MKALFEVAGGSITGTEHRRIGKNNQDAYYSISTDQFTIAVVCDGCGSSLHSEVGAKIGARLVVEAITHSLSDPITDNFWAEIWTRVLTQLQNLAQGMGGDFVSTVADYFLFTIVGALLTPISASVFSIGDGAIAINGKIIELETFPGNAPPYLAYSLIKNEFPPYFQLHQQLPISEVESILIGTDGVKDLINVSASFLPDKNELVGDISQFWESDRYFRNADMVRRKLSLINNEITKADWHNQQLVKSVGLLPDDTTLVVIRVRS